MTVVDDYWGGHTVNDTAFGSAAESLAYLAWRSEHYPLFHDLMGLWGDHKGEVVVDYGCGPGNDMVGFLTYAKAERVIGLDVSEKAIGLAAGRLALHDLTNRSELIRVSDAKPIIPLESVSVDHINCEGVLQHTSHPAEILAEFRRILRPRGTITIMVYNFDSLWTHLVSGPDRDAFRRSTDGEDCPISIAYRPEVFEAMCRTARLPVTFRGGYFNRTELDRWREVTDPCPFVRDLEVIDGYPYHHGLPAGLGGVYR